MLLSKGRIYLQRGENCSSVYKVCKLSNNGLKPSISSAINCVGKQEKKLWLPPACSLVCWTYFFDPEDRGDMFLRNVSWNSTDYTASYLRRWYSSGEDIISALMNYWGWIENCKTGIISYPRARKDSTQTMPNQYAGAVTKIKAPGFTQDQLASKHKVSILHDVLKQTRSVVNYVKPNELISWLLKFLCDKMGTHRLAIAPYRRLFRGTILNHLYNPRNEAEIFLMQYSIPLAKQNWNVECEWMLTYLVNIFELLIENLSM
jgi:hypothetical protein